MTETIVDRDAESYGLGKTETTVYADRFAKYS